MALVAGRITRHLGSLTRSWCSSQLIRTFSDKPSKDLVEWMKLAEVPTAPYTLRHPETGEVVDLKDLLRKAEQFVPTGSLAQQLEAKLPQDDVWVQVFKALREAKNACDSLEAEDKARPRIPPNIVTLPNGDIDEDYYVEKLRVHPSFVTELRAVLKEAEESTEPFPQPMQPLIEETLTQIATPLFQEVQDLIKENKKLTAKSRQYEDLVERIDELTVDELLEKFPDIALEIKDEIEAGRYEVLDAGSKLDSLPESEAAAPAPVPAPA